MKSFDLKKYTPHLLTLAGLLALALYFALPTFRGMQLAQHDTISWKAMSQEARAWHEKTGENTLWSNSQFGGMPTYTFYVPESKSPLGPIYHFFVESLPRPANFLALAMVCFYILGSVLRWNRWLRVLGAVAYGLSTYNLEIIAAGHETKMLAMGFMPAVLAGFILIYRGRYLSGAALFALFMAMFISTGHYQINYYAGLALIAAGVGFLIMAIREGWLPRFAIATVVALVSAALAVGVTAGGVLPTMEYNKLTMRGGQSELTINKTSEEKEKKSGGLDWEYAMRWSNGIGETFNLMIPDLYGGSSAEPSERAPKTDEMLGGQYPQLPIYWGPQPFRSGQAYMGAIVCFLAVLGLMIIRSPHKWWMLTISVLGFLMSWGMHFEGFNQPLFYHLPLLKNFRTPSMVLVLPQLFFPVLGAWGLHEIVSGTWSGKEVWKKVRVAAIATAGLCIVLGLLGEMFFDFTNPATDAQLPTQILDSLKEDRQAIARNSALLSAFWIVAAAALLWAYTSGKVKAHVLGIGMTVLILFDLLPVATRYMNEDNFVDTEAAQATFQPRPVDQQILQDKDPNYRVLDLSTDPFNDAKPAYFHKLIGGYSPAKLESYQDLIDIHLSPAKGFTQPVLQMLNTKYIITPGGQGGQPQVIPMPNPAGNGWFVSEVKWVNTADEQMLAMNGPRIGDTAAAAAVGAFDPVRTAVIRNSYKNVLGNYAFGKDAAAQVRMKQYGLNNISYTTQNSQPGLAVFSEIWYPHGWKAFIDGKEEPIICANYLLRALKIPAGQHTVEFKFQPASVATGNRITMISSVLILLLCAAGIVAVFRQKQHEDHTSTMTTRLEPVSPTAPMAAAPRVAATPKPATGKPSKKG